jgi:hypothetical protein
MTEFYEVSRTKLAARNGRLAYTKIAHLADALHPARLVAYLCYLTRGQGPKTLALRPD